MSSKSVYLILSAWAVLFGCSTKNQLAPNLCLKESSLFSSEEITTKHIEYFGDHIQLVNAGHYLSGVYALTDGDLIYTSVYKGSKLDSILHAEEFSEYERKRFGDHMFWFNTSNQLYLFSSKGLVVIDFPPSRAELIVPEQDRSEFFQLCE